WILARTLEELEFVHKWLPEDGTSHESPTYMIFGLAHLTLAMQSADRCLGTEFTQDAFFENVGSFLIQTLTPGLEQRFTYGDGGTGVGQLGYDAVLYHTASIFRQGSVQSALDRRVETEGLEWGWMGLVWFDPTVKTTPVADLAKRRHFDDIGLVILRDSWDAAGSAAMFKCGPMGGVALNRYRNANKMVYVNVAHDDPDANSFTIFANGEFVAETDRYSRHKQSANHNTILVNGIGQLAKGRQEGGVWSQPGGNMLEMGRLTAYQEAGGIVVAEGEAAGSYIAVENKRPALERFRRTFVWVEGKYILVLDDIRAPKQVKIEWLVQSGEIARDAETTGRYILKKGTAQCPVMIQSSLPVESSIVDSPADHRGKPLGWRQLRLTAAADAIRFVSLSFPWGGDGKLGTVDWQADTAVFEVRSGGTSEAWEWTMASDGEASSKLRGLRDGNVFFQMDVSNGRPLPLRNE
ncbi:MAG: heparinase II/III domain-containing protein, partial [Candidatus Sumerlaeota bacterium]